MSGRPLVYIVDGSRDTTGALAAVRRMAGLFAGRADFVLVVPAANRMDAAALPEFARVRRLPMVMLRRSPASLILYFPSLLYCGWVLRRWMRADGCGRLMINDFYLMQGAMARLLGYRGRLVTWIRIDPVRFGMPGRLWLRAARKASDRLVAVSAFIQRRMGGLETARVYDPYVEAAPVGSDPGASRRLVFIGNYIEGKGQDVALAAFTRIAEEFPDARLVFHGGDMGLARNRRYREALEETARTSAAAGQIGFEGFVPDPRTPLRDARAALVLSVSESFSLTCQEASACGLPVIATRCGGPEEIVEDGASGFLVPVGDVDAVADGMRRLLADPELARSMGARGAAIVEERFGAVEFERVVEQLLDLPPDGS